jgi:hypothetical protein
MAEIKDVDSAANFVANQGIGRFGIIWFGQCSSLDCRLLATQSRAASLASWASMYFRVNF